MKTNRVIANRKDLEREIAISKKVIGTGCNLAICQSVMLSFLPGGNLAMSCTNLEHAYTGFINAPGSKGYHRPYRLPVTAKKILVNIDIFKKIVSKVPKKIKEIPLEITWDDNGLLVNNTTTIISGGKINEYPVLPKLPWGSSYDLLSYEKLVQINSIPASDDRRAHIISLYVDTVAGNLVSTDGSRLYSAKIPTAPIKPFMIPKATVKILISPQLKNEIGRVRVRGNDAFIETGHGFISARIVEGEFPVYEDIFSIDDPATVVSTPDKQAFIDVMAEASAIMNDQYRGVTLVKNGGLFVEAVNPDLGEFNKDISNDFTATGDDLKMSFDSSI